jgi:NADH:ubiquinone reductase (non-electrogenic)
MKDFHDVLKHSEGKETKELNIEEFKKALAQVDSQVKMLPATAQVICL